ncbi:MAG: hypothetical protein U1A78_20745 [Polyangia bacterium]
MYGASRGRQRPVKDKSQLAEELRRAVRDATDTRPTRVQHRAAAPLPREQDRRRSADLDLLTRPAPELTAAERGQVNKVARELLAKSSRCSCSTGASAPRPAPSSQAPKLHVTIEDILDGRPSAYSTALYQQKCAALFEHLHESDPERDKSVYQTAG